MKTVASLASGEGHSAGWLHSLKPVVAALLCVLMADQPMFAAAPVSEAHGAGAGARKVGSPAQLEGDARVLHALNRFTFGPRPGDVAAVEKLGLNRWFEMQLNPSSIDDFNLQTRLAAYPAMELPLAQLEAKYPGPQVLKQLEMGRGTLPADPAERAMVQDQLAFYKGAQKKQQADAAAAADASKGSAAGGVAGNGMSAAAGDGMQADSAMQTPAKKKKQVDAGLKALQNDAMQDQATPMAAGAGQDAMMAGGGVPDANGRALAMRIMAVPADQRMQAIMALSPQELLSMRAALQGPQFLRLTEGMPADQKERLQALAGSGRMIAVEAMETRLERDIYSERQLEAVMTDFWLNHFNVYARKNQQEPYYLPAYERETVRPHALGKFEDLLVATAESPAMLVYLDNFRSVGPDSMQAQRLDQAKKRFPNAPLVKQASAGLNENYGRELMELHTLGVNGGYTQADVTNVAKVFTGWGLDRPQDGASFKFDERRHEPGDKMVLGQTIHEAGEKEGLQVLHLLATSPATAHFISEKLAVRFVSDTPSPALVDRMSASFLASGGDIKTVLRTMFNAPEFWSTATFRAKVKTPEEFLISAVRASGADVISSAPLVQALDRLGMPLYGMQTPNGYSWLQDGWVSTGALVSRMNFALVLSGDRLPGTRTDWDAVLGGKAGVTPAGFTMSMCERSSDGEGEKTGDAVAGGTGQR